MKTKIWLTKMIILMSLLSFPLSGHCIKIKYKGSGGLVMINGKNKICPNEGKEICAIVDGSWRDLFSLWWQTLWESVAPGETGTNQDPVTSSEVCSLEVLIGEGQGNYQGYLQFDSGVELVKDSDEEITANETMGKASFIIIE